MTSTSTNCPRCRAPLSAGLCASCLLASALERGAMDEPAPEEEAMRSFAGYDLIEQIGRGGMGVVWRAREEELDREVALKMLAAAGWAGPDEVRRFRMEAETEARFEHPNIVPVYAVGDFEGRPFFTMKLAVGTLAGRRIPPGNREAAEMLAKIGDAVHFAHERGVLHRDLKPANILLDTDGTPMVCDFGFAHFRDTESFTLTGAGIGTPAYMAPEQAGGGAAPITTATDVYGLGALLYHQLTGHAPFEGPDTLAILRQLASAEPIAPRALNESIDRDLEQIALKAMAKQPGDRYRSAAAFVEDLERWLRGEPTVARPAGAAIRIWKWARRKPATAVALGLTLVGAAVLAIVITRGEFAIRHERNLAFIAEADATKQARHARDSERLMRLNLYAADMMVASRALRDGHLGVARETLERHIPKSGEADLRGFEWFAFQADCRGDDLRVLTGHTKAVDAVAFSRDGKSLATTGRDGQILFWNVETGVMFQQLPRADVPTNAMEIPIFAKHVAASPEARAMLTGNPGNFDAMRMRWRPSKIGGTLSLAWSPDGRWLVSGGAGSYMRVWEVATGTISWFVPVVSVSALAFSDDGAHFVATRTHSDGVTASLLIYDFERRTLVRSIENVRPAFALLDQGNDILIAKHGNTIERQNLLTGAAKSEFDTGDSVSAIASAPSSPIAATIDSSGTLISLWDLVRGTRIHRFANPSGERFRDIALSPDGKLLAAVGADHLLRLVDVPTFTERTRLRGHGDEILAVRFSPGGSLVVTGGNDRTARVWPVAERPKAEPAGESSTAITASSPTGRHVLFQHHDGTVECWDGSAEHAPRTPADFERVAAGFLSDGSGFVTTRRDSQHGIIIENWSTSAELTRPPRRLVPSVQDWKFTAFSAARNRFGVSDGKKMLELVDPDTGLPEGTVDLGRRAFDRMSFSPDGRFIAAYSWPDRVSIIDTIRGTAMRRQSIAQGSRNSTALSPDSRFLASSGDDNLISIYDLETGAAVATLRGHKAKVQAIAFTPDGRTLASSSADRTLRLWHIPTARELGVLKSDVDYTSLAFTANPVRLLTVGPAGRAVIEGRSF